jgi:protein-L-isoaspartate(D-aspartate) O-methyltransferase
MALQAKSPMKDRRNPMPMAGAQGREEGGPDRLAELATGRGIASSRVVEAFRRVRREEFVPIEERDRAYEDIPLPIGHEQVTTQPSLVARMVEALHLREEERVLEIGTGLGFQTAILGYLCREVHSVERYADLAAQARRNLQTAGVRNAHVHVADGTRGLPQHAPYDAIVTCAAAERVPPPLVGQLVEGGALVHPLGPGGSEDVMAFHRRAGALVRDRVLVAAFFVPLVGEFGAHTG